MRPHPPDTLGLPALERFLVTAMVELVTAEETLNSLNVYPVPDGDTGSNLRATWAAFFADSSDFAQAPGAAERSRRSHWRGGASQPPLASMPDMVAGMTTVSVDSTDESAIRTGLRRMTAGARGNAGVIMSEYLRGCCESLQYRDGHLTPIDGDRMARMLHGGAAAARTAVDRPVEGTMLSVAEAAAAGAARERSRAGRLGESLCPATVLDAAVKDATKALKRSPQQLPVLAGAGVVDSGGAGLLFVLEALARVAGGRHGLPRPKDRSWLQVAPSHGFAVDEVCQVATGGPAFEVMAVVEGMDPEVASTLRGALSEQGDSVVVAGGDGFHRVHVHTDDVLAVVSLVRSLGKLSKPSVTRFAGVIPSLHEIQVDVADPCLRVYADALGFHVSERAGDASHPTPRYLLSDGLRPRERGEGASEGPELLGAATCVHAVATMEACAFLAACDEEPDYSAAAVETATLEVRQAGSWLEAEGLLPEGMDGVEQVIAFIDPDAPTQEVAEFGASVRSRCEEAVMLRMVNGALVQIGVE